MARILFFGRLADLAGSAEIAHRGGLDLTDLVAYLEQTNIELATALRDPSVRVARNLDLIPMGADPVIGANDEIAFMPPLSGG
jgi:sulfur-carrier protein